MKKILVLLALTVAGFQSHAADAEEAAILHGMGNGDFSHYNEIIRQRDLAKGKAEELYHLLLAPKMKNFVAGVNSGKTKLNNTDDESLYKAISEAMEMEAKYGKHPGEY